MYIRRPQTDLCRGAEENREKYAFAYGAGAIDVRESNRVYS